VDVALVVIQSLLEVETLSEAAMSLEAATSSGAAMSSEASKKQCHQGQQPKEPVMATVRAKRKAMVGEKE